MELEEYIRKQARSGYWQQIYEASKECNGVNMFENTFNFSSPQYLFLYWLKVYNLLYTELASKEWINLTENVINNDFRCDAFLTWRRQENEKKLEEYRNEERKQASSSKKSKYAIYRGPIDDMDGDK